LLYKISPQHAEQRTSAVFAGVGGLKTGYLRIYML
jgi:hypothetical protein